IEPVEFGITIQPSNNEVTLQPGDAYRIAVSGGKKPYRMKLVGKRPPEGVSISRAMDTDADFIIATTPTVSPGEFQVMIFDAAEAEGKTIEFRIEEGKALNQDTKPESEQAPTPDLSEIPGKKIEVGGVTF